MGSCRKQEIFTDATDFPTGWVMSRNQVHLVLSLVCLSRKMSTDAPNFPTSTTGRVVSQKVVCYLACLERPPKQQRHWLFCNVCQINDSTLLLQLGSKKDLIHLSESNSTQNRTLGFCVRGSESSVWGWIRLKLFYTSVQIRWCHGDGWLFQGEWPHWLRDLMCFNLCHVPHSPFLSSHVCQFLALFLWFIVKIISCSKSHMVFGERGSFPKFSIMLLFSR